MRTNIWQEPLTRREGFLLAAVLIALFWAGLGYAQRYRADPSYLRAGPWCYEDDHLTGEEWANGDRRFQTAYTVRSTAPRPEQVHDHPCRDVPQPASLIIFDRLG